jgi:ribosome-associated translation inhibitor RaiA
MTIPFNLHFQNVDRSPALEDTVRKYVDSISRFYDRITDCQVTIQAPHKHQAKGTRYKVVIKISVPGDTLVVSHEDESNAAHEDCYVTVRDAFRSARRQLQDFARIQRNNVKSDNSAEKRQFRSELGKKNK